MRKNAVVQMSTDPLPEDHCPSIVKTIVEVDDMVHLLRRHLTEDKTWQRQLLATSTRQISTRISCE